MIGYINTVMHTFTVGFCYTKRFEHKNVNTKQKNFFRNCYQYD